ncbi:MAG: 2-dehydropantoate 2-reductase N-terminal domain-containing protein [Solirubrobacteraceae bacterium]
MRYVIYGAGAIGGVIGARRHQAGHQVALIARGAHLEAIRHDGLLLTTPAEQDGANASGIIDGGRYAAGVDERCDGGDTETSRAELTDRLREEARGVLAAAEIEHADEVVDDIGSRWERLDVKPIGDRQRAGSSSRQSLARGAGTIETDFLNGEIVLLGRLYGVPTPLNQAICRLADDAARGGAQPGELSIDESRLPVPS